MREDAISMDLFSDAACGMLSQIYLYYMGTSEDSAYIISQISSLYLLSTRRGCLLSVNSVTFLSKVAHQ